MKPAPDQVAEGESEPLFDYALLGHYLRFALGALRRHKLLGTITFLIAVAVAALSLVLLPKTWHAEAKLIAQRNPVLQALGNPSRTVPADADAPTRAAVETILRRDSLVSLIEQTDLIAQWHARRAPAVRALDAVFTAVYGEPKASEKLDDFVELLEKHLRVLADEGTVTIAVDWPDAQMAFQLVETAQQDFLETRHVAELSAITEAIGILEQHANRAEEGIGALIDDVRKAREQQDSAHRAGAHRTAAQASTSGPDARPRAQARARPQAGEIAQLQLTLAGKRRAIEDLEEFRRRRVDELQQRLTELRVSYAPAHPLVRGTEESLTVLSTSDSPQLAQLKREERDVRARIAQLTADTAAPSPVSEVDQRATTLATLRSGSGLGLELRVNEERDPSLEYGDSQLRIAVDKYQALLERLEGARIELDTTRAAFKYRYVVMKPARVPRKPVKPRRSRVLLEGLVAGVFLAVGAAVARDLKRPRLLERWQVERWLGLKVLAERSDSQSGTSAGFDFWGLWLSARKTADWRWLTVVPLHSSAGSSDVGCALRTAGELKIGERVELVDARNLGEEQLALMVAHINAKMAVGATAIAFTGPPSKSPPAIALALNAEAVLVTFCYGIALDEAREALRLLAPSLVIGCVIVPPGNDQLAWVRRGPGAPAHGERPAIFGESEKRETPCS